MYTEDKKEAIEFPIDDVLKITLEIASLLITSGAEVRRVEDTISRICKAYNLKNCEVFSITSIIIITATSQDDKTVTQTKRIYDSSLNLIAFEKANALSREICSNPKPLSYVLERTKKIKADSLKSTFKINVGYLIGAGAFSMFFGGNVLDSLSAILVAFILLLGNKFILKPTTNRLFYAFSISALMGISAIFLVNIGIGVHTDKIIIGDIMLLIPGMALVNSMVDMFCGDFMTGTMRVINSLLTAFSIAGGFLFAFGLMGGTF